MKRVVALALTALTALAAGCGSGSSHPVGSPSQVIRQGDAAVGKATSAAFRLNLDLALSGSVSGLSGAGAMLSGGHVSLALRGRAARGGRFEAQFALNYSGGSLTGSVLSADGHTGYVRLPLLFGPGWHSFTIPASGSFSGTDGLDPARWLKGERVGSSGGLDTVSAALDVPALIENVAASSVPGAGADRAQLRQVARAIKTASGSIAYDSSTHLPARVTSRLVVVVPAAMETGAHGIRGLTLTLNLLLNDWNQSFSVTAPAGATPIPATGLGGL